MDLRWGQKLLQCAEFLMEETMKKSKPKAQQGTVEHGRGTICHNALEALVTSVLFR